MVDLLIQNATVIDGTGAPGWTGTIGVQNGKIVSVNQNIEAARVIDASGMYLAPGFIDMHSHGDLIYGQDYARLCKTAQGITTEICGQCGLSMYPVRPEKLDALKKQCSLGTYYYPEEMVSWRGFREYSQYVDQLALSANTMVLTGHGALRIAVMGFENRKPTREEMEEMKRLLREAMENGSLGLSTGLIYPPGCYADTEELVELAKVVAEYGGIYTTHMRNESAHVVEAVKEAIEIGRRAGVHVDISHHKIYGKPNWGKSDETLALINAAVSAGQRITVDQYPYEASMTNLNVCIPPQYFDEGVDRLIEHLKDKDHRRQIEQEMKTPGGVFDNYHLNCGWDRIFIATLPKTPEYTGMFVSECAEKMGVDSFEAYFRLLIENDGEGTGIYFSMCDEDMDKIICNPNTVVGTDGLCKARTENGHPRAWGSFPHAIRHYCFERKVLSLEEMIHKMTLLPAQRLGLESKGRIGVGFDADLVLFDPDMHTLATYRNSNALTEGLNFVIVNGEIVYEDGKLTGRYPGKLIRHKIAKSV